MYTYVCNMFMYVKHVIITKLGYIKRNMLNNCMTLMEYHYLMLMEISHTDGIILH